MYRLKIEHDNDAQNPRKDHDNADIMFCKHSRYTLGDEDADDPFTEVSFVRLTSPNGTPYVLDDSNTANGDNLIMDEVLELLEAHAEQARELADDLGDETSALRGDAEHIAAEEDAVRAEAGRHYLHSTKWESEYRQRPGIALCRPLYLYDHSGITISAGSFGCEWDSGQVGWQYVTDEALQAEWAGDEAAALRYMDATLQTYDDYITGNVHGFEVERGTLGETTYADGTTEPTIRWEHEDSCWGFYGDWHGKDDPSGMGYHLDGDVRKLFDSLTWSDEGEWQYTDDVPEDLRHD